MKARLNNTAAMWKLNPWRYYIKITDKSQNLKNLMLGILWGLFIVTWQKEDAETHMQQSAGCVSDDDGLKCPKFESLLEHIWIYRQNPIKVKTLIAVKHNASNMTLCHELKNLTSTAKLNLQILSHWDIGRFQEITASDIDLGNSTFSGLAMVRSLQNQ